MKFIELVCGGEKYSVSVAHIVAVTPAEGGCMLYLSAALMNRNTLVQQFCKGENLSEDDLFSDICQFVPYFLIDFRWCDA
jgi:hypothetical protein